MLIYRDKFTFVLILNAMGLILKNMYKINLLSKLNLIIVFLFNSIENKLNLYEKFYHLLNLISF